MVSNVYTPVQEVPEKQGSMSSSQEQKLQGFFENYADSEASAENSDPDDNREQLVFNAETGKLAVKKPSDRETKVKMASDGFFSMGI